MSFKDYYKILNITPSADEIQIKKAFRIAALKWHPDKCKEPDAKDRFIFIYEAYEILSNSKTREVYDNIWKTHYGLNIPISKEPNYSEYKIWEQAAHDKGTTYSNMRYENFIKNISDLVNEVAYTTKFGCIAILGLLLIISGFVSLIGNIVNLINSNIHFGILTIFSWFICIFFIIIGCFGLKGLFQKHENRRK